MSADSTPHSIRAPDIDTMRLRAQNWHAWLEGAGDKPLTTVESLMGALTLLSADVLDLVEQLEAAHRALEWYAERRNYTPAGGDSAYDAVLARDGYDDRGPGARARAALASFPATDLGTSPAEESGRTEADPASRQEEGA